MGLLIPKPTTLGTWPNLKRLEEVGKGWRRRGDAKDAGDGWREGEQKVKNEGEWQN